MMLAFFPSDIQTQETYRHRGTLLPEFNPGLRNLLVVCFTAVAAVPKSL